MTKKNSVIICVMGKTNSGKDFFAQYLNDTYKIPSIISYTNVPKRDDQEDGIHHFFISDKKMAELKSDDDNLLGYYDASPRGEYCTTIDMVHGSALTYVINPDAIPPMQEKINIYNKKTGSKISLFPVFIYVPEDVLYNRGCQRGDDPDKLKERLDMERPEFDSAYENKENYIISNDGTLSDYIHAIDEFIERFQYLQQSN